jgi:dihydrofolate reductase
MNKPLLSIIVAIQKNDRGIGYQNDLLFKISEDQRRFKALTTGHPIIMGRKTFESIGRALPNRTNIVITRNAAWSHEGVLTVSSLEEAITEAKKVEQEEVFVIGGSEIYSQALDLADCLYITVVDDDKQADTFFPEYETVFAKKISSEPLVDSATGLSYTNVVLEK